MQGQGPFYAFRGKRPSVHPEAWVAPTAAVIGDVEIGAGSGIWFHCVVRGDVNIVRIGERTNIQDGSIIHVNRDTHRCLIGSDVTVGHMALVHACTLKDHAFVGMGSIVLDGAVIEEHGMLAAGAVLAPGKCIGPGEMWAGVPARLVRVLSEEDRVRFARTAVHYSALGGEYRHEYYARVRAGAAD